MIYFGTDGIRGVAVSEITQEMCFKCGNALGSLKDKPKIIVGTDTRVSAGFMFSSFASGLTLAGADVYFVGVVPTPAVSFLTKLHCADFGVMLTASHNSAEYNGIKIFDCNGYKIADELASEIERRFTRQKIVKALDVGKIFFRQQYINKYINFVVSTGSSLLGCKIVIDSANGAGYRVSSKIFKKLGAEVISICAANDGLKINQNCGALYPQKLSEVVKNSGADFGFAFDGDADRVILVDENGDVANGDQILLFLAKMYKENNLLNDSAVVGTIQTNITVEREFEKLGLKLLRTDVGDKYVLQELKKRSLTLGGEQAGHIILMNYAETGDGLLCAVQIAKLVKQSKKRASENIFKNLMPQHSIDIFVKNKFEVINSTKLRVAVTECEQFLNGNGRIVTRASGTEPKIRIMVESEDSQLAELLLNKLKNVTLLLAKCG